jgi:hypothetical protein
MGKYRLYPWGVSHLYIKNLYIPSLYREMRKRPEAQPYIMCLVCFSVVLMGRETDTLQLLASNLLTRGERTDMVICSNVVLKKIYLLNTVWTQNEVISFLKIRTEPYHYLSTIHFSRFKLFPNNQSQWWVNNSELHI